MEYWEAVLLGIVQGLTEFLPVSSSGHLVLGKILLGLPTDNIAFEVFVHFGTLLAVITVFRSEVWLLLSGVKSLLLFKVTSRDGPADNSSASGVQLLTFLIIGTLPAGIVGYLFKEQFEATFSSRTLVFLALICTGLILMLSRLPVNRGKSMSRRTSLLIGIAQIAAILPGISRSGTTITAGMLLGLEREEAARFSFLLAIPLILAATLLQSIELLSELPGGHEVAALVIGTVAAYLSGIIAIKWLLLVIQKERFHRFAYYCVTVGAVGLLSIFVF